MRNIWLIILTTILLGAFSCSIDDNEKTVYTVTFDTRGGTPVPETQYVDEGGTVTVPTNPAKAGYVFMFWHLPDKTTAYNFNIPIRSNLTLQAEWKEESGDISLNKTSLTLYTTDRERLMVSTASGNTPNVTWSTSNENIVMVNEEGVVKATGAGNATITATVSGKSVTCSAVVNPAVFVAGELGSDFGDNEIQLWKNGKRWVLNDKLGASIRAMFIHEGDVYLVGTSHSYSHSAVNNRAIVFKLTSQIPGEQPHPDDEEQYVMETTGKHSYGNGLFVSNGDIYACGEESFLQSGYTNVYYYIPTVWKNGKRQHLTSNTSGEYYAANAIFISGNDVYVAGQSNYNAAIWKNGIIQELPCEGAERIDFYPKSEATSIFISGSDVYAGGYGKFRTTLSHGIPDTKPVLWKNGKDNILQQNYGSLLSVFISGNDVYALGYEGMWKNGVLSTLDKGTTCESIFVYDNDVYTAGYQSTSFIRLWKNGIPQVLEGDIIGHVYSVIVK